MKKITFVIGGMTRGGAERVISILANHYANKDWKVDIVLLLCNSVNYDLDKRIRIIDMSKKGSYFKNMPKWIIEFRKYVKCEKPNKIVSFIGRINMLVLTATLGMNVPIIVSERNDPKHDGRGRILEAYSNFIYRFAQSIIFQTEYEKSCFSPRLYDKSYIIPNPVNIMAAPKEVERLEIVTAGRLLPQKNHKMLIDAFEILSNKYKDVNLKIYGAGALKSDLQKQIDDYGKSDVIQLCGNVIDLHEKISGALAFVMTSEFEGLSNALIEAMMLGIPCISTNYPGADELIINEKTGILVPCDDVEALFKAMEKLIMDVDFRKELSKNAIRESQNYDKEKVLSKWDAIIDIKEL